MGNNLAQTNKEQIKETREKWIKDLNVTLETVKLQQENTEENLPGPALGKDFMDMTPEYE